MALTGRPTQRIQTELVQDLARIRQDGRSLVQSGSRLANVAEPSIANHLQQGQLAIAAEITAQKEFRKEAHTAYQNAEAIVQYANQEKPNVRLGKHAAAVDQIHQNDLHNIDKVSDVQQSIDSIVLPSGKVLDLREKSKKGSRGKENGSNVVKGLGHDSELTTSFDPMKDRHRWAMWRTAVNGRIVDEVRYLEKIKIEKGLAGHNINANTPGMYGTALVVPPLKQFIRFDSDDNEAIAKQMLGLGPLNLRSFQFVYFGLPRVQLAKLSK